MKAIYQIVGMKHRGTEALVASLKAGDPVMLMRDAFNEHDSHAVAVWAFGTHIGFVKGTEAPALAARMDSRKEESILARFVTANRWPQAECDE
jgi:hypothetical protein